jgi:hypothetical protein
MVDTVVSGLTRNAFDLEDIPESGVRVLDVAGKPAGQQMGLSGDPTAHFRFPLDGAFDGQDFMADARLDEIGEALRRECRLPSEPTVAYRWKRKGGEHQGQERAGFCQKLSGAAKHFAGADYLVWLACDNLRDARCTNLQVEAYLFHELNHVEVAETEDGEPVFKVRHHDVECFFEEVARYGFWKEDQRAARDVFKQVELSLG